MKCFWKINSKLSKTIPVLSSPCVLISSTRTGWGKSPLELRRLTVSPAAQLVKSPQAIFRTQGMSFVSIANQHVAMSPDAKKHSVERPIGIRTFWNDPWLAEKFRHTLNKKSRRGAEFIQTTWLQNAERKLWNLTNLNDLSKKKTKKNTKFNLSSRENKGR